MRVLVTGGTGFIGRALIPLLRREGHSVTVWARSEHRARGRLGAEVEIVDANGGLTSLIAALEDSDAVVNLAGEPIMGGRWTPERRAILRDSRVGLTDQLVTAMAVASKRPRVLISGSAVGYYGERGDERLTEYSSPGRGFLAGLCEDWEAAALRAEALGLRVVLLRTGVVLGRDGGALAEMLPPFSLGLGGPIGSGRQFLPWIHLYDLARVIAAALADDRFRGPVNGVAPEPVTSRAFAKALGRTLRRPAVLPTPVLALRAVFGEAASVLVDSQRVDPAALKELGFSFAFSTLDSALADILGGSAVSVDRASRAIGSGDTGASRRYLETRRPRYELRTSTLVAAPLNEAFAFFSKAENLGMLTPAAMNFSIHGRAPAIGEDATISYRLRVGLLPIEWRSRIVSWMPGSRFVDLQEQGPYSSWWHEHSFRAVGATTLMEDRVCYAPPLGVLGRLVNDMFIVPRLRRIFQYRADVIRLRFGAS
jgi:uncharacterized protein (TIGR01777 family)